MEYIASWFKWLGWEYRKEQQEINSTTIHDPTVIKNDPEQQQHDVQYQQIISWHVPDPWPVDKIKPELVAYVKDKEDSLTITFDDSPSTFIDKLKKNGYLKNDSSQIIFISHGFINDLTTLWLSSMKDEILKQDEHATVIIVGWGGGAHISIFKYSQAAANTQTVAVWLADHVKAIKGSKKAKKIWGIAHSIGAHLMGLAGRHSGAFDRITGLDPAGPSFEKVNVENRLCSTDAEIVDVIHTDGYDTLLDPYDWFSPVNHYGTLIPLGCTDFYVNWGFRQPGASGLFTIAGSHHRSIDLFIWSISNPGKFKTNVILKGLPGFEAPVKEVDHIDTEIEMGFHYKHLSGGCFYLPTKSVQPWELQ